MSEVQLHSLIRGILVPGGMAAFIFIIGRLLPSSLRRPLRATGLAAAVGISYVLLLGLPTWFFKGSPEGVWIALILVSVLSVFDGISYMRIWARRYVVIALIALSVLRPLMENAWPLAQSIQIILALGAVGVMLWWGLESGGNLIPQGALNLQLIMVAGGSAVLMMIEGSASIAQITGALASALGAVWVLSFLPWLKAEREFLMPAILILFGLIVAHYFYVDANLGHWLWILTPMIWPFTRAFWRRTYSLKSEMALALAATMVPLSVGLVLAYKSMAPLY